MDDDQELSFGFGVSHVLLAAALEREDANVMASGGLSGKSRWCQ
jgi:hypothetical protein